jgi:hypothetical protein
MSLKNKYNKDNLPRRFKIKVSNSLTVNQHLLLALHELGYKNEFDDSMNLFINEINNSSLFGLDIFDGHIYILQTNDFKEFNEADLPEYSIFDFIITNDEYRKDFNYFLSQGTPEINQLTNLFLSTSEENISSANIKLMNAFHSPFKISWSNH